MARAHHEDHLLSHEGREGGAAREVDSEVGGVRGERYRLVGEQARRRVRRRGRETNLQAAACGERWSWVLKDDGRGVGSGSRAGWGGLDPVCSAVGNKRWGLLAGNPMV